MIETKFKSSIPDGWEVKKIGEVATICGGGTPSTNVANYWGGKINWFTPAEISEESGYVFSSERKITEEGLKNSSAKLLPKGSVLLTTRATIGNRAIAGCEVCTNQGFQSLIPKDIYNIFLYYNIATIVQDMRTEASGSTFLEISGKKLSEIQFIVPPSTEQTRIATALSDIDDLIATTRKLTEKKRNIKKGAMQELLSGKRRLPGYTEKWVEKELWEICDRFDNLRVPVTSSLRKEGNTPYYGANGIQDYVEGYTHDGEFILIAEDGANSLTDYPIQYVNGKVWVNNHAHVIKAKEKMANNKYLSYGLKTIDFESNVDGSTRIKLTASKLMQLKINLPNNVLEQQAIASVLSDMDSEIQSLESRLTKYQSLKQGMMQQLLTGKIRLI